MYPNPSVLKAVTLGPSLHLNSSDSDSVDLSSISSLVQSVHGGSPNKAIIDNHIYLDPQQRDTLGIAYSQEKSNEF